MQQGPVENFGEHGTIFSMRASTNITIQSLTQRLGETNEDGLRQCKPFINRVLQVRLPRGTCVR